MRGTIIGSGQTVHRFEPTDQVGKKKPKAYMIAEPTRYRETSAKTRMQFDLARAAAELGVKRIVSRTQAAMMALLRQGIDQCVAAEQKAELCEIVDQYEAAAASTDPIPTATAEEFVQIEAAIMGAYAPYRHAAEDRAIVMEIIPDCTTRRYVTAIENGPKIETDRDGLTNTSLAKIPPHHRVEIHMFVTSLSGPDPEQEKN